MTDEIPFTPANLQVVQDRTGEQIVQAGKSLVVDPAIVGGGTAAIKGVVEEEKREAQSVLGTLAAQEKELAELESRFENNPFAIAEAAILSREIKLYKLGLAQRRTVSVGRIDQKVAAVSVLLPEHAGTFRQLRDNLLGRSSGKDLSPQLTAIEELALAVEKQEVSLTVARGGDPYSPRDRESTRYLLRRAQARAEEEFQMRREKHLFAFDQENRARAEEVRKVRKEGERRVTNRRKERATVNIVGGFVDDMDTEFDVFEAQFLNGTKLTIEQAGVLSSKLNNKFREALQKIETLPFFGDTGAIGELRSRLVSLRDSYEGLIEGQSLAKYVEDAATHKRELLTNFELDNYSNIIIANDLFQSVEGWASDQEQLQLFDDSLHGRKVEEQFGFTLSEMHRDVFQRLFNGERVVDLFNRLKRGEGKSEEWQIARSLIELFDKQDRVAFEESK